MNLIWSESNPIRSNPDNLDPIWIESRFKRITDLYFIQKKSKKVLPFYIYSGTNQTDQIQSDPNPQNRKKHWPGLIRIDSTANTSIFCTIYRKKKLLNYQKMRIFFTCIIHIIHVYRIFFFLHRCFFLIFNYDSRSSSSSKFFIFTEMSLIWRKFLIDSSFKFNEFSIVSNGSQKDEINFFV